MLDLRGCAIGAMVLGVLLVACDGTSLEERNGGAGASTSTGGGTSAGNGGGSSTPSGGSVNGSSGTGGNDIDAQGGVEGGSGGAPSGDDASLPGGGTGGSSGSNGVAGSDGGQTVPGLQFVPIDLEGEPTFISHFRFIPGSSQFLALRKLGTIYHYDLDGDATHLLGSFDIPGVETDTDCGLISLAFDPDFATNHYFYVGMCFSVKESGIVRYEFDAGDYAHIADSGVEILRAGAGSATKGVHSIGHIGFDPDGNMWALFGEKNTRSPAQDPDSRLGKLLRFKLQGTTVLPLSDADTTLVYAMGFRSPWTGLIDAEGRFWVGDVGSSGEDSREEVNLIPQASMNFGWPEKEGVCGSGCSGFDNPLVSWRRGDLTAYELDDPDVKAANSRVAWVGMQYQPNGDDPYAGLIDNSVLFGDLCLGFVRGLRVDENNQVTEDRHLGHLTGGVAWAQGPGGYVYAITYNRCTHSTGATVPPGQLMKAVLGQISIE